MVNTEKLLKEELVEPVSGYWKKRGYQSPIQNWNELAKDDHMFAAVSADNQASEQKKSEFSTNFLLQEGIGQASEVVLDLGCGYGRAAKYLWPFHVPRVYIGVDSAPVMLDKFQAWYAQTEPERRPELLLVLADIDDLPLKDETVEAVIVSAVFLHNPKELVRRSLREITRLLRPGGRLYVIGSFPNLTNGAGLQGTVYLKWLDLRGQGQRNGPVRYFTESEVKRLLADFADIKIYRTGFSFFAKSLIGLPKHANHVYRKYFSDPLNGILEKILPSSIKKAFCVHFDCVAVKK